MRLLLLAYLVIVCSISGSCHPAGLPSGSDRAAARGEEAIWLLPEEGECPLVLIARVEKERVPLDSAEVAVYVEVRNVGSGPVAVYTPGLKARLEESYDHSAQMPVDGYGPPRGTATLGEAAEWRDNFVILRPGDLWGHRFSLPGFDTGSAKWLCFYTNEYSAVDDTVSAWVGTLTAKSESVEIYCDDETLNRILDAVRHEKDPYRCVMAIRLLYPRKAPEAIPVLLEAMLSDRQWRVTEEHWRVTEEAAYALRRISGEKLGVPDSSTEFDAKVHVPLVAKWAQSYIDSHPDLRGAGK